MSKRSLNKTLLIGCLCLSADPVSRRNALNKDRGVGRPVAYPYFCLPVASEFEVSRGTRLKL